MSKFIKVNGEIIKTKEITNITTIGMNVNLGLYGFYIKGPKLGEIFIPSPIRLMNVNFDVRVKKDEKEIFKINREKYYDKLSRLIESDLKKLRLSIFYGMDKGINDFNSDINELMKDLENLKLEDEGLELKDF